MTDTILQSADEFALPLAYVRQPAGASAPAFYSDRQPATSHGADDVARHVLPQNGGVAREASSLAPAGDAANSPAGTLSRHQMLRIYGGPSLETRRDDLNVTIWLSATLGSIALVYAMLFAGWGVPIFPHACGLAALFAACMFAISVPVRNYYQARIDQIEAVASEAVSLALSLPQMGEAKAG